MRSDLPHRPPAHLFELRRMFRHASTILGCRSVLFACGLAMALVTLTADGASAESIDFQRDVQPILAERCLHCHGVDEETRHGGLRLDQRASALEGGDSGTPALVAGKPDESELLRRVMSADDSERMPPPSEQKSLTPEQLETLRQWIAEGAVYEEHWAFTPPVKPALPAGDDVHPVDALVRQKLAARELPSSPPAASGILCRRLYLDVIGLPPTPEQLAAFEQDGFEKTLDALLASQRYGEKWARHWLDVARYSDTNGYEKDLRREQWIWRDWVIGALNADMPYNQFLIEQVAGDLLPGATQDQRIATGLLRNSMINEEGAIVAEQFRMVEMFDRMDCLGKAVLGLTTQCAQCHSHKFDPIAIEEYYGMFAFLNNSYEAKSWVYSDPQLAKIDEIRSGIEAARTKIRQLHPQWQNELQAWQDSIVAQQLEWEPIVATELGSISGLNHPTQEPDLSLLMLGHTSADMFMIAQPALQGATGLRLEALTHGELPFRGPGRSDVGTFSVQELEVLIKKPGGQDWEKLKLVQATADFSQPEEKHDEGKRATGPVKHLIDGNDSTTWNSDRGIGRRNQPSVAVVQFEQPLDVPEGTQLKIALRMGDMLGCCRFSLTRAAAPTCPPIDHDAMLAMATAAQQRTATQQETLFDAWMRTLADAEGVQQEIDELWKQFPQAITSVLHLAEREPARRRTTHLLERGAWDKPLAAAEPLVPAAFHPLAESDEPPRLRFARWLADPRSPLTARVAVNRAWQAIFGAGLVETSEDFGTRAPVPEHREVLDWLAVDFMEHGWSQKHLIRTILTSATYQQSSLVTPQLLDLDPNNRWLARGPRFRAEAEVVRDIALSVSGLITHKVGGPGVIPPVPQNVLDYNYVYPAYWKPAEGPERYRRAVYGFRKRSMPDPAMSSLDAPNGDFSCSRRVRSNTPLAALTSLNEPIFVEAARALALRVLREGGSDDEQRSEYAFLLCVARQPTAAEKAALHQLLTSRRQRLAEGWLNVREITTGDPARLPELPPNSTPLEAAAWTIAARVLLNLDETITKN